MEHLNLAKYTAHLHKLTIHILFPDCISKSCFLNLFLVRDFLEGHTIAFFTKASTKSQADEKTLKTINNFSRNKHNFVCFTLTEKHI